MQRQLGFKRYETVWTWLHKLRRAMVRPGRDQLSGRVEVDETYVGGVEEGVHGRQTEDKSIVAALLKRWWLGTHQGAIRPKYLDYYLDEFTFRFNRRSSRYRGKLFYRLVQQAAQVGPVSWTDVAGDHGNADHNA